MLLLLFFVALFPGALFALFIYFRDSLKKEPLSSLFKMFMGGIWLAIPILLIEFFIIGKFYQLGVEGVLLSFKPDFPDSSLIAALFLSVLFKAFTEEWAKLWLLKKVGVPQRDFDEMTDGIVYPVFGALGFGLISYTFGLFLQIHPSGEQQFFRALTYLPMHMIGAGISGYFFTLSHFSKKKGDFEVQPEIGYYLAVLFHLFYELICLSLPLLILLPALFGFFGIYLFHYFHRALNLDAVLIPELGKEAQSDPSLIEFERLSRLPVIDQLYPRLNPFEMEFLPPKMARLSYLKFHSFDAANVLVPFLILLIPVSIGMWSLQNLFLILSQLDFIQTQIYLFTLFLLGALLPGLYSFEQFFRFQGGNFKILLGMYGRFILSFFSAVFFLAFILFLKGEGGFNWGILTGILACFGIYGVLYLDLEIYGEARLNQFFGGSAPF